MNIKNVLMAGYDVVNLYNIPLGKILTIARDKLENHTSLHKN